ncbi:MAG TPA: serine hydrolase domain-containing protein, partial [Thermomonospora sp.]|nr:serine hydrolase domain-containing protein [Thermomonospora sp.]
YRIGSTTKTFVAVVVLQLVAEGRLTLDDTVDRWLPGVVTGNGNDGRRVTVRHLLRHTSGLADYVLDRPLVRAMLTDGYAGFLRERFRVHRPEELVAMAMRHPPHWLPAGPDERRWTYSNTNYVLAGMLIEQVTGRHWYDEVRDRILRPLGLRSTVLPPDVRTFPTPHATAYLRFPGDPEPRDVTLMADHDADGGLVSTPADVNRFFGALLGGLLLPPAQLEEMQRTVPQHAPGEKPTGTHYGLGLYWSPLSCGGGYWTHDGSSFGVTSHSGALPGGRRTVTVAVSTSFLEREPAERTDAAASRLVDHALCAR